MPPCQNHNNTYLKLFFWIQLVFVMLACSCGGIRNTDVSYTALYDSLVIEMAYLDSLAETGNLLAVENRFRQLQETEGEWLQVMDAPEYGWICFWMAYFSNRLGDLPQAKKYSELAIDRIDSLKMTPHNLTFITTLLNNTAGIEAEMGNFSRSTELLFRAMEYYKGDTINEDIIDLYNNIGHNYNVIG